MSCLSLCYNLLFRTKSKLNQQHKSSNFSILQIYAKKCVVFLFFVFAMNQQSREAMMELTIGILDATILALKPNVRHYVDH